MDKRAVEPFTSAGLRQVVPVGQRQVRSGYSITVFSLELYVNGFMVVTGIEGTDGHQAHGVPRFHFHAKDDLGGNYRSWDYPGGNTPGRSRYWRYFYLCGPDINPDASSLRLGVREVKITEMPHAGDPTRGSIIETKEQIEGP